MGYVGSEEFIRVQFEEYLLSLISSVKYHAHLARHAHNPRGAPLLPDIEGDPSHDFAPDFVDAWSRTENHRLWAAHTDSHLFDIVEPRHPCAGGLTIDDIQRRITQQVQDMHWDERFAQGREVLGRNLAAGREKASTLFNKLYADMEGMREAQRRRVEEARAAAGQQHHQGGDQQGEKNNAVDLAKAQQTMQAVGSKAGAFVNSWAAWAGEKRRAAAAGWGKSASSSGGDNTPTSPSGGSSGWGAAWGKAVSKPKTSSPAPQQTSEAPPASSGRRRPDDDGYSAEFRPLNSSADSVSGESMLDDAGPESALSSPGKTMKRPVSGGFAAATAPTTTAEPAGIGAVPALVKTYGNGPPHAVSAPIPKEEEQEQEATKQSELSPRSLPAAAAAADAATTEAAEAQGAWEKR